MRTDWTDADEEEIQTLVGKKYQVELACIQATDPEAKATLQSEVDALVLAIKTKRG